MPDSAAAIKSNYPLPVYNYRVTIMGDGSPLVLGFSEVSGLGVSYETVAYKHGLSFLTGGYIIPGMRNAINVTLKRGLVAKSSHLQDWLNTVYKQPFALNKKRDVVIDLCDETGKAVVRWTLQRAMPTSLSAPTFDANSNDVAIETMELVAHGLLVNHNP